MSVEWRPVFGWEGHYEVSTEGDVRSVAREISFTGRWGGQVTKILTSRNIREWTYNKYGHRCVTLHKDGQSKNKGVHRLVAEAFILNPLQLPEVAHNNGNPADNRVSNLRWDTPAGNQRDRVLHGTTSRGELSVRAKFTADEVRHMRKLREAGATYVELAKRFNASRSGVRSAVVGRTWKYIKEL